MRTLAILFLLAQFAAAGPPQQGPLAPAAKPGTGLIVGREIDGASSQPIAGAILQIRANNEFPGVVSVLTAADGQFAITSVPAGTLSLLVAKKKEWFSLWPYQPLISHVKGLGGLFPGRRGQQ